MGRLEGKVCIVTGAAAGMGRHTAMTFAAEGASVVICDMDAAGVDQVAHEIAQAGGTVEVARVGDLTKPAENASLVAQAEARFGGVDVVYNNAARAQFAWMDDITPDLFDQVIREELAIAFYLCHAAWPALLRRGGGSIINVASLSAHRASDLFGTVAHNAAKGGVLAMTRQLASEGGRYRIRANSISPGLIASSAQSQAMFLLPQFASTYEHAMVLGRVGRPEDVASYAVFLASDGPLG